MEYIDHIIPEEAAHTLINLLADNVTQHSHHTALCGGSTRLSYAQLWKQIHYNAAKRKVLLPQRMPGGKIGVCMPRQLDMVLAIWTIMLEGGAYVPADPKHPIERIVQLYHDAGVQLVYTTPDMETAFAEAGFTPLIVEDAPKDYQPQADTWEKPKPNDIAYVLFTSGSTGIPKGVQVHHAAVVNLVKYMQATYPLQAQGVVLFKSPYTFDGSIWELFGALLCGGCIYIAPPDSERDPAFLTDVLRQSGTHFTFFVPAMLHLWLSYLEASPAQAPGLMLRWVSVGGDVLDATLVKRFYAIFKWPETQLINVYGPTETTVYATTWCCTPQDGAVQVPLGLPVLGNYLYIVNKAMELLPQGQTGEICIGGKGVATGYLNRPDLNHQLFVPNPFGLSGNVYRTGDLGYLRADGALMFAGRKDFQVKLRGLRIELGEIETHLLQAKGIAAAVVTMHTDMQGTQQLVAYLMCTPQIPELAASPHITLPPPQVEDLRAFLAQRLPAYMIPAYWYALAEMPLTTHGKIDRKHLPNPWEHALEVHGATALWTAEDTIESSLQAAWQLALSHSHFTSQTHFFEAGGNSLNAVQVLGALQKALGVWIPLQVFYKAPVFAEQLVAIKQHVATAHQQPAAISALQPKEDSWPLTEPQEELLLLHEMSSAKHAANIVIEFTLKGAIDIEKWRDSFEKCIAATPVFHTAFCREGAQMLQRQGNWPVEKIIFTDISHQAPNQQEQTWELQVRALGSTVFDLQKPPLYKAAVVQYNNHHYKCLWVLHHIVFDGWSLQVFARQLKAAYNSGEVPAAFPTSASYTRWLLTHADYARQKQKALTFWKEQLRGYWPQLRFAPGCYIHKATASKEGARHWFHLPVQVRDAVQALATRTGGTPFAILLTAWRAVVGNYAAQEHFTIATPFAQRNHLDAIELTGYFTNMLPLIPPAFSQRDTATTVVKKTTDIVANALSHHELSYGHVVQQCMPTVEPGRIGGSEVIFVLQNWPAIDEQLDAESTIQQKEIGNGTHKVLLYLTVERSKEGFRCFIEHPAYFAPGWIETLANHFATLVEGICKHPKAAFGDLLPSPPPMYQKKSCLLLGEGTMAQLGAQALLQHGMALQAIVAPGSSMQALAQQECIPIYEHPHALPNHLHYAFLFSINNRFVIAKELLQRIEMLAINYHDSLLPAYAGLYATSYALLDAQKVHGISWHRIDTGIDTGTVLARASLPVAPDSTAEALNLQCFEKGMQLLREHLPRWEAGQWQVQAPLDVQPSYHGLGHRPAHQGIIDPNLHGVEVQLLLNATTLGVQQDNPFMLPVLHAAGALWYVAKAHIAPAQSGKAPGNCQLLDNAHALIALQDATLVVEAIWHQSPAPIAPGLIWTGEPPNFTKPATDWLTYTDTCLAPARKSEAKQVACYLQYPPFALTMQGAPTDPYTITVPADEVYSKAATVILYLLRLSGMRDAWIASISKNGLQHPMLLAYHPLALQLPTDAQATAAQWIESTATALARAGSNSPCEASIYYRYPALRHLAGFVPQLAICHDAAWPATCAQEASIVVQCTHQGLLIHGLPQPILACLEYYMEVATPALNAPWNTLPLVAPDYQVADANPTQHANTTLSIATLLYHAYRHRAHFTAIMDGQQRYTYEMLAKRASQIAAFMRGHGLQQGDVVGVQTYRSFDYIATLCACLNEGIGFLPTDTHLPQGRWQGMLADASARAFLQIEPTAVTCEVCPVYLLPPTAESTSLATPPMPTPSPHATAYILFTSGSTGRPKGVRISQEALATFVKAAIASYALQPEDRVLQFANLAFDTSIEEIFPTLVAGATLVLSPALEYRIDIIEKFVMGEQITVLDLPTAYWRQWILKASWKAIARLQHLRLVIVGGEAMSLEDVKHWQNGHPLHRLLNTYGPTETTVVALAAIIDPKIPYSEIPIGTPLPGYRAMATDAFGHRLPYGIEGMLWIAGPAVSSGYCNASQEAFAPPLGEMEHATQRWYQTGDRVMQAQDGQYFFRGRKDSQLKIRGFRVEIAEIEQAIRQLPGILEGAVVVLDNGKAGKQLGAVYTGKTYTTEDLVNRLQNILPPYMVPTRWMAATVLPLTANGKTDTETLLQWLENAATESHLAPANATEKRVHDIWCSIFQKASIDVALDFFAAGGHSLMAVQLASEVQDAFGKEMPLATLLSHGSIRALAHWITDESTPTDGFQVLVPIRTEGHLTPLFLVHGAGLNVMLYQSLAMHLPAGRPIYALQARGLDGKSALPTSITAMAADYIQEIKNVRPSGPYMLLGFSAGGFVVYEMAQQLHHAGDEVMFTGLIDAIAFSHNYHLSLPNRWAYRLKTAWNKLCFAVHTWQQLTPTLKKRFLKHKVHNLQLRWQYYKDMLYHRNDQHQLTQEEKKNADNLLKAGEVAMMKALNQYKIVPSRVPIDLFKARQSTIYMKDPKTYGWVPFTPQGLHIFELPGDHSDLFDRENAPLFAEVLHKRLLALENKIATPPQT